MNSDTEKELRDRAKNIILNYSIASGTASGALAIGATLGADTALSVSIVIKMITELGSLFGLTIDDVKSTNLFKVLSQKLIISSLPKSVLSFLPGVGNVANGFMTYYLIQSIGWAVYEIFKDGKNLLDISEEEVKSYLRRAEKDRARY